MTTQTIATLKGYFNTGDTPTEANFADLIDTAVGSDNIVAALAAASAPSVSNPIVTRSQLISINAADYGASPTADATTNRAAIQAAITACPQFGRVVIPGGIYDIDGTLTISNDFITLSGDGMAMLSMTSGTGHILTVTNHDCTIENIYLTCTATNAGDGLHVTDGWDLRLKHVFIVGAQYHACYIEDTWNVLTTDCAFDAGQSDAGYAGFYHGTQSNAIVHLRSRFFGKSTTIADDVVGGSAINFEGCTIESLTGGVGIRTDGVFGINIRGCYFEGQDVGIQIGGSTAASKTFDANISGNYWWVTPENAIGIKIQACYSATLKGNLVYGVIATGSVGVFVDGTTTLVNNVHIEKDNLFYGVAASITDAAGRAVSWCEQTYLAQHRIDFRSSKPIDGGVWGKGSIVINTNVTDGQPVGWIADKTAAAVKEAWVTGHIYTSGDFTGNGANVYRAQSSGTAGTIQPVHTAGTASDGAVNWLFCDSTLYTTAANAFIPFGQVGVRQGSVSPAGIITPNFVCETYIDYTVPDIYMSINLTTSGWKKIT